MNYDDWLANSAPGVNDVEKDEYRDVECDECGFEGEVEGTLIMDGHYATLGMFHWECSACDNGVLHETEVDL